MIAPGIADVGRNAGRLLAATAGVAYLFTIFSGLFSYSVCELLYPLLISGESLRTIPESNSVAAPYFNIEIPPLFGVMSALIASFMLGVGMTVIKGVALKNAMDDFKSIIILSIEKIIIPFLPLYIFGIFLSMTQSGQIAPVFAVFIKIIILIFAISITILLIQYSIAGFFTGKNPLKMLKNMLPAFFTALGTQSSAATIPVTLAQTKKNGIREEIADFTIYNKALSEDEMENLYTYVEKSRFSNIMMPEDIGDTLALKKNALAISPEEATFDIEFKTSETERRSYKLIVSDAKGNINASAQGSVAAIDAALANEEF